MKISSSIAILIVRLDTALLRLIEEDLFDVKTCLHSIASRPEGP